MTSHISASQAPSASVPSGAFGADPPRLDLPPDQLAAAVHEQPAAYWYLVPPDRLHRALANLPARTGAEYPLNQLLYAFTACGVHAWTGAAFSDDAPLSHLVQAVRLRLAGHPRAALERMSSGHLEAALPPASALFDTSQGWRPLVTLQSGVAALLAGDFSRSAGLLSTATFWRLPDEVRCLEREAHAKYALLHALVGDAEFARHALETADRLPETASWREPEITYASTIAANLLDPEPSPMPDGPPLPPEAGEMWPFAIWSTLRTLFDRGHLDDALVLLSQVERAAPPGISGDGVARSLIPVTRATVQRMRGDHAAARVALEAADPDCDITLSTRAHVNLDSGLYSAAIDGAELLMDRAGGLRRLRIASTGVIAAALLRRGDGAGAAAHLRTWLNQTRTPSHSELRGMPEDAVRLLRALMHDKRTTETTTPGRPVGAGIAGGDDAATITALTRGEEHLLMLLATNMTRQEIANELFLSINTIKTRCLRLYRRLGVQSRTGAVTEARRRGII